MSDALPLPLRPNLEQYKKLAKELLKACKSADPGAMRAWAGRWAEKLAALDIVAPLYDPRRADFRERLAEHLNNFVRSKLATAAGGQKCSLSSAQFAIARLHGFLSWPKFAKHVEALARARSPVSKFEAAADAIVSGDSGTLTRLLRENPELIRARSTREHRSTLLHYVSANGVEDFRQKTPKNIVEIARLLLEAGADVNAESDAYAGGSTTLGLVATSCHPADAGVQIPLMQVLLDAGSRMDQPSAAGNAQSIINGCFANGRPAAAEFLASRGARLDLEGAAGLGRLDVVKSFFNEDGSLKPNATKAQMEAGFTWACSYGHRGVVEFLLERGVGVTVQGSGGETGLHCAAAAANLDIVKLLLQRKAPLEAKNVYGGTVLGQTLWSAVNSDRPGTDYAPIIETLLDAGAELEDGSLAWLEEQKGCSPSARARIAEVLRRHGATS